MSSLKGKAWLFGNDISTDHIAPGRYFHLRSNLPELTKHVLEDARADFAKNVQAGDFVVAGENFGLGSSREHAPTIIKLAGVGAVLAKSFARIFFRNAVNIGLPVILVDTSVIGEGDQLEADLEKGLLRDLTNSKEIAFRPLSKEMARILKDGGLVEHIKKHGDIKL
ncbi:MAG: 3-isopropylmalate dehydratase small subunit [Deltaproteobacteria bacterium]|nr:3-isopropylmalate dehydratase small subunit [Deltaproteobacteria bacterium]